MQVPHFGVGDRNTAAASRLSKKVGASDTKLAPTWCR